MCDTTKTVEIHPFEAAGLGLAPFRYIGMEPQNINANGNRVLSESGGVSWETKPGGSCDFCGAYILDIYRVRSKDGKEFKVGSDCIKKVGMRVEALTQLKADLKALAKKKAAARKEKEAARILEARRLFLVNDNILTDRPHPHKTMAERGATLRDYVEWMYNNAGHSGKLEISRLVEKTLA